MPESGTRQLEMSNWYRHTDLEYYPGGGPKEFRILKIHGGTRGSTIRCEIKHYPLPEEVHQDASVDYEALSWTWGHEENATAIKVISPGGAEKDFPIKKNLRIALDHLRHQSEPRNIWVDFICINQANNSERAAQVKLMFFIYSKAFNVCIWLGEAADNSTFAVDFVRNQVNDLGRWTKSTEEHNKENWAALAALMDRPWFSRRWIVQELALAKKATVHCADDWMYWTEFETAVALFDRDAQRLSGYYKGSKEANFDHDFFGDVAQMGACRLVHLKSNLFRLNEKGHITEYRAKLTDLVSNLWSFEAQDPHDLIYAILSIAKDTYKRVNISPRAQQPGDGSQAPDNESVSTPSTEAEQPTMLFGRDRERVEGVFSALRHAVDNRTVFHIDYTQDYFLVCKQFLKHVIPATEQHNLDIILRPWSPFKDKGGRRIPLPSWVPTVEQAAFKRQRVDHAPGGYRMVRTNADPLVGQVTHGSRGSPYNASRAPRSRNHQWKLFPGARIDEGQDRSLIVTGFVLDKIERLLDASQHGSIPGDWLVLGGLHDRYGQQQETTDALWRTLVADRGPDGTNTMPYYQKAFERAVHDSEDGINSNLVESRGHPVLSEFLKRMKAVVTKRRLFKGQRMGDLGHLGLAPKDARHGDCKFERPSANFQSFHLTTRKGICIIKGMSVPVVLRPIDAKRYTLIGECYLHTMMDGEAIDFQEERTKALEESRDKLQARIDELAASLEASPENESLLRRHRHCLEADDAELASLSTQMFELR